LKNFEPISAQKFRSLKLNQAVRINYLTGRGVFLSPFLEKPARGCAAGGPSDCIWRCRCLPQNGLKEKTSRPLI